MTSTIIAKVRGCRENTETDIYDCGMISPIVSSPQCNSQDDGMYAPLYADKVLPLTTATLRR
jgi:hypothetical protein